MVNAEDFSHTLRTGVRAGNRVLVVAVAAPRQGAAFVHASSSDQQGISDSDINIYNGHNDNFGDSKVGFIVAKKQLPLAVDRNLVKRRLRHAVKPLLVDFPSGSYVVIRVLAPALDLEYAELEQSLKLLVNKALNKLAKKNNKPCIDNVRSESGIHNSQLEQPSFVGREK